MRASTREDTGREATVPKRRADAGGERKEKIINRWRRLKDEQSRTSNRLNPREEKKRINRHKIVVRNTSRDRTM